MEKYVKTYLYIQPRKVTRARESLQARNYPKMEKKIENIVKHADVSEKVTEAYLVRRIKDLGGVCLKYSNPGVVGYPDRVAVLPGGVTVWVEVKSRGKRPNKVQQLRHEQLRRLGHNVAVVESKQQVDFLLAGVNFISGLENDL